MVNGKQDGKGNTYDVTTDSLARRTHSKATSGQNEADRVCNIYDLEGNCFECVAEKNSKYTGAPFVYRGGNFVNAVPASYRNSRNDNGNPYDSFRFTLYVM